MAPTRTSNGDIESGCGGHCYKHRVPYCGCSAVVMLTVIVVLSSSWDTIEPTEYGLLRNGVTGVVDMERVYEPGRYFVGPSQRFLRFPSQLITLSYGNRSHDAQASIPARRGADTTDSTSSGGQPVSLSLSFQYQLRKPMVPRVYQTFGTRWETSYLRFAQQAITNIAQEFTPRGFWTQRKRVETAMKHAVNASLFAQGFAMVPELQLRAVGFQSSYEQTITGIQLQEQLKVTKSYQLEVTRVQKEVDLLQSETDAAVLEINAEAQRERAVIEGEARAAALEREQRARATMYAKLREHLGWGAEHFLQYMRMKALNAQPQSNVVVGVDPIGGMPA